MRRSLSLIAILAVAAAAWALPGAGAEQTVEAAPLIDRQAQAVCPYVVATDTVDTIISVLAPGARKAEHLVAGGGRCRRNHQDALGRRRGPGQSRRCSSLRCCLGGR